MLLKCGQKDNQKYTFGIRKDQMEDRDFEDKESSSIQCPVCGKYLSSKDLFCSDCGEKL